MPLSPPSSDSEQETVPAHCPAPRSAHGERTAVSDHLTDGKGLCTH